MITTRLSGGLGNQMFQYAAGQALAWSRGTQLQLDLTWFQRATQKHVRTRRSYELSVFALGGDTARFGDERWPLARRRNAAPEESIRTETQFNFDATLLDAPDGTVLDGYWQSERYFEHHAAAIRAAFRFTPEPSPATGRLLDEMATTTSVSVHVRRGDYVADPHTAAYHGAMAADHYHHAVEHLAGLLPATARVYVFSDDVAWCRQTLRFPLPTTFVDHNRGDRSFEDLWLMSNCRHHVLANSSFSWWGAWLAEHPGQEVIAPARWFTDDSIDTSDLVPSRWRRLEPVR